MHAATAWEWSKREGQNDTNTRPSPTRDRKISSICRLDDMLEPLPLENDEVNSPRRITNAIQRPTLCTFHRRSAVQLMIEQT